MRQSRCESHDAPAIESGCPSALPAHAPEHVAAEATEKRCLPLPRRLEDGARVVPGARAVHNKRLRAPRRPARRVWHIVGSSGDSEDRSDEASALPQEITCALGHVPGSSCVVMSRRDVASLGRARFAHFATQHGLFRLGSGRSAAKPDCAILRLRRHQTDTKVTTERHARRPGCS